MSTKDQKIKEFLQTKRAPLDEWNTHEQLCLASAVACSGDQNWMSVSRALKGIVSSYNSRPSDWFLSKSCATQYGKLLESCETPKRKKRTASERDQPTETPSTPVESLVKKLTAERIIELKKAIHEEHQQYAKLKEEMLFLQSSSPDETKVREMWNQIEQEKIQKEREQVRHDQWLKEREEKKLQHERQWRGPYKSNIRTQKSQDDMEPDTTTQQQSVSHSQSAPTLITLLDKRQSSQQDTTTAEKQLMLMSIESGGKDGDIVKDEEAELLADFNELIDAEKFDMDEDLEDLNSIIMNPEILEEKISDGEPIKDDCSQTTSTDDYDKLKIKQIVETIQDLAGVPDVETSLQNNIVTASHNNQEQPRIVSVEENEILQDVIPSEPEHSSDAIEMVDENNAESNDSITMQSLKTDVLEEKIVMISDESSNTNEEKKDELNEKIDLNDGEESQSVKSSIVDDVKDASGDDSNKEPQTFQQISIAESDENSMSSEKEIKEEPTFHPEDSEDAIFEEAKDHNSETEKVTEIKSSKDFSSEKSDELSDTKSSMRPSIVAEIEEASHSAIDSDEEVLEVKASRSNNRRKGADSLKADTPSSSTRSRDHSENDDNRDSTPIRTRSRHSSIAVSVSESKTSFTFSKEQEHSIWKGRWEDCVKELQKLKEFSHIIDNRIIQDEVYKKVCLHPMNMKIITKNIETNISTLPSDIKRDFVLMCTNIIMLNNKGQKFNEMVHDFTKDCLEIIDTHMEIEDVYKSYRRQIKKKS
ncbi:bromodomain-containing protein 8 isoform X2 [Chironomus tepperi]|uniref:bromodomain-containing protein 8 isoform X2 n=1 Tax=Chironomus tepperi TaxID=113505 RepID=UPI00391FBD92